VVRGVAGEHLVVEIISTPVGKSGHGYLKNEIVNARKGRDSIGQETWVVISERELQQAELRAKLDEEQAAREAQEAEAKIAAIRARDLAATENLPSSTWNEEWEKMNGG
jgi:uncharacterized alpha-E superfamily protein